MENCRLKEKIEDLIISSQNGALSNEEKNILKEHLAECDSCLQMEKEYRVLERILKKEAVPVIDFPEAHEIFKKNNGDNFMHWKKAAIFIIAIGTIVFLISSWKPGEKKVTARLEKTNSVDTVRKLIEVKKGSVVFDVEKGTVYLQKYMGLKKKASKTSLLELKDSISTTSNSGATVYFSDFVKMKLTSNSTLQYFKNYVHLRKGKMNVNMFRKGNKFTIKTPFAMAGIVGTDFSIAISGDRLKIIVREGIVKVWNEKGVENVKAGQSCMVYKGEAPHLKKTGAASAIKAVGTKKTGQGNNSSTDLENLINK